MKKNNKSIDDIAKKALKDFEVPFNADHWTKMEEELKTFQIDTEAQKLLKDLEVPFNATHWQHMDNLLDGLDQEEKAFDESIRQDLENAQSKYQPKHWDLMNQRLEQEFSWKGKVVRYKVIEATLMLLLLFTAYNLPDSVIDYNFGVDINNQSKELSKPLPSEESNKIKTFQNGSEWRTIPNNQAIDKSEKGNQQTGKPIAFAEIEKGLISDNIANKTRVPKNYKAIKSNNLALNTQNTEGVKYKTTSINNNLSTNNSYLSPIALKSPSAISFNKSDLNTHLFDNQFNKQEVVDNIDIVQSTDLTINSMTQLAQLPKISKSNTWWRLSIFGAPSTDYVTSSYVYEGDLREWTNLSFNQGAGITVIRRKGNIEFALGLVVNKKSYKTHLPKVVLTGEAVTGKLIRTVLPEEVTPFIIQIPLSMNYQFKHAGRWSVYTTLGASFNAVTSIDIVYPQVDNAITTQNSFGLQTRSASSFNDYGKPYKFLSLHRNEGNYFLTAQAGIGVEYKISSIISTYVQPLVEKHVGRSGVGTRNDKINSLSVQAGLKMQIGKK